MAPCYVVRASVSRGQDAENRVFPALLIRRSRVRISQFPPPNSEGNKLSLFVSLFFERSDDSIETCKVSSVVANFPVSELKRATVRDLLPSADQRRQ